MYFGPFAVRSPGSCTGGRALRRGLRRGRAVGEGPWNSVSGFGEEALWNGS